MSLSSLHLLNKPTGTGNINLLFLCHFLSTWNARSYEFATTLFIAQAFPEGLSFVSWSGISTSLSIIVFASTLGRWIDLAPSRLQTLVTSICFNRVIVIMLCFGWAILLAHNVPESPQHDDKAVPVTDDESVKNSGVKVRLFQIIILLGMFERLSRVATLLSIERDWVPNLALLDMDNKFFQAPHELAHLNAVMSRIDLVCKLLSPIAVTYLILSTNSAQAALWCLFGMNVISWPLECWTAWRVWSTNASLRDSKQAASAASKTNQTDFVAQSQPSLFCGWAQEVAFRVVEWAVAYARSLHQYFSSDVWMPSVAVTSLHFSVLSFSGLLTVFLLQSGFSTRLIMWGEVFSAIFELSSTFVFAWGVRLLSVRVHEYVTLRDAEGDSAGNEDGGREEVPPALNQSIGSSRLGMWAVLQMFVVLVGCSSNFCDKREMLTACRFPLFQHYGNSPITALKTRRKTLSNFHPLGNITLYSPYSSYSSFPPLASVAGQPS